MPWSSSRPGGKGTAPVYRKPEHRKKVQQLHAELRAAGVLRCSAPACAFGGRIYAADLDRDHHRDPRYPHADHQPGTQQYRGLAHAACNRRDGSVRARARQDASAWNW